MAKASGNGTSRVVGVVPTVPSLDAIASETSGSAESSDAQSAVNERRPLKLSTVSHTLDDETAERLRHFAFRERISESAVIEQSLRELFGRGDDAQLGRRLRELGAGLRRKA
jgi:predicted transcriptional regulator